MKAKNFAVLGLVAVSMISLAGCGNQERTLNKDDIVYDERVEPTCTETGLTAGAHYKSTGEVLVEQYEIPALGHSPVTDEAVEPTCTETGLTGGSHCEVCGEILQVQEVIPAKGHSPVNGEELDPTCTHTGHSAGTYCEDCGEILEAQEIYEALGHTPIIIPGESATCTEEGYTDAVYCTTCEEYLIESEIIAPTGHTTIVDPAVEPTCTEAGLTAGSHCGVCGEVLVRQEPVSPKGHSASDFVFDDNSHWKECPDCTEIHSLDNHKIVVGEETTDATYSYIKYKERKCEVCGYDVTLVNLDLSSFSHYYTYTGQPITPNIPLPDFFEVTSDRSAEIGAHILSIGFKDSAKYQWYDLTSKPVDFYYVINPIKVSVSLTFKMLPSEEEKYKSGDTLEINYFSNYNFSMFEKYNVEGFYGVKNKIELPLEGNLSKYFATDDEIYPIYKSSSASTQGIKITATEDKLNLDINAYGTTGKFGFIYEVNPSAYYFLDTDRGMSTNIDNGSNIIGVYRENTHLSLSIPRFDSTDRDRVYDKYYLATSEEILKGPVWTTEVPSKYTPGDEHGYGGWEKRNEKGCFTLLDPSCQCDYANVNFVINGLIYSNELYDWETGTEIPNPNPRTSFGYSYDYNGTTYYFNTSIVDRYDYQIKYYAETERAKVCLILLNYTSLMTTRYDNNPSVPDYLMYPGVMDYYEKTSHKTAMAAFNTSNPKGADYLAATLEFLADRYSSGEHGYVINYTIGNEIDFCGRWNCCKDFKKYGDDSLSLQDYCEEYHRTLRIATQAVTKKSNDAWTLVPFTRSWASAGGGEGLPSYIPQKMFNIFCEKSNTQGNFKWGMNAHPYSDTTGSDSLRSDRKSRADIMNVPSIRQGNLDVLDMIMGQESAKYNGQMRPVYILEGGISAKNQSYWEQQAASLAYYLIKARLLKSITALVYYRGTDSTGETGKYGLMTADGTHKYSYDVFKDYDSIEISEWNDKYVKYLTTIWLDDFGESMFTKKDNYLTALVKFGSTIKTKVDFKMRFLEVYGPCRLYIETYGEDATYQEYVKTHK